MVYSSNLDLLLSLLLFYCFMYTVSAKRGEEGGMGWTRGHNEGRRGEGWGGLGGITRGGGGRGGVD